MPDPYTKPKATKQMVGMNLTKTLMKQGVMKKQITDQQLQQTRLADCPTRRLIGPRVGCDDEAFDSVRIDFRKKADDMYDDFVSNPQGESQAYTGSQL